MTYLFCVSPFLNELLMTFLYRSPTDTTAMLEREKPFNFTDSVLHPNSQHGHHAIVVVIKAIEILAFGNLNLSIIYADGKGFDDVCTPRMLAFVYILLHEFFKSGGSQVFIGAHGMSIHSFIH